MNRLEEMWASRRRADIASVKALADVLRNIVAHPADFLSQQALPSVLHSQGNLAKYAMPELSVRPMSLNHQRRMADMALGGYQHLDDLRRAALDALNAEQLRAKRGNKKTKDGLAVRVKELELEVALLKRDLALLQLAYDRRCVQARNYARSGDSAVQALCAKEQRELDATFSLRRRSEETTNVVLIDEKRRNV